MTTPPVGLCQRCRHVRRVESARGSVFYMCERSRQDDQYTRYPRLPVLACAGFEPGEADAATLPRGNGPGSKA